MAELPYDDAEPMESPKHRHQTNLLIETLHIHLADRDDVFIGGNMGVYYTTLQAIKNEFKAPDFFVVLGVPYRERTFWVVWEEGRGPDLCHRTAFVQHRCGPARGTAAGLWHQAARRTASFASTFVRS